MGINYRDKVPAETLFKTWEYIIGIKFHRKPCPKHGNAQRVTKHGSEDMGGHIFSYHQPRFKSKHCRKNTCAVTNLDSLFNFFVLSIVYFEYLIKDNTKKTQ